jgi:polyketide cyclase/dehydrase/lipid transport protein
MARSHWHKLYTASIKAPADVLFGLLSDLPNYGDWLPGSSAFGQTTDVEPYPVRLGTRYHDGKPDAPGRDWRGTVTGFQPPGSLDFHHTIHVRQLRATVDVHIHYSLEAQDDATLVTRWLLLDVTMPIVFRPLRPAVVSSFDAENARTMAALKAHAEARPDATVR